MSDQAEKNNTLQTEKLAAETEEERLRRDIYRSDMEKFRLFVDMLRVNKMYAKAKVTHK